MKAQLLPSGSYRVQVYCGRDANGRKVMKSFTAKYEWEALKMATDYTNNTITISTNKTVYQALDEYINIKDNILSPASLKSYRTIKDTRLQLIRDIPIADLKPIDIQRAVNYDAQRLTRKSIKSALGLLKSACSMHDVEINLKKITLPSQPKKKGYIPTDTQVIEMIMGTDIELPCLLAMWLSLRISEIRGLQFRDVSSDGKFITIQRTKIGLNHGDVVRDVTKTEGSTRTNRLPKYLYDLIQQIPHTKDTDFIVPQCYEVIRRKFKALTSAKGYDITFHTLRHEFATTLNDLGVPPDYIQKLGGWSTDNVMKSVYTHTTLAKEQEYQDTIDKHFNSLIEQSSHVHTTLE